MMAGAPFTTLFLNLGGVLFTDAWVHYARRRAAPTFALGEPVGAFVSASFVCIRKPAPAAMRLGIRGIVHTAYVSMCRQLTALGLLNDGDRHEPK